MPAVRTRRDGHNVINYEIAHIRDEQKPSSESSDIGWRYWPDDLTQDDRNKYGNLLLLCKPCHKLIDKVSPRKYSVELLKEWKDASENEHSEKILKEMGDAVISEEILEKALVSALGQVNIKLGIGESERARQDRHQFPSFVKVVDGLNRYIDQYASQHRRQAHRYDWELLSFRD